MAMLIAIIKNKLLNIFKVIKGNFQTIAVVIIMVLTAFLFI